jgi:hypothetical protein
MTNQPSSNPKKLLDQLRAKPAQHLPTTLSKSEVSQVLNKIDRLH